MTTEATKLKEMDCLVRIIYQRKIWLNNPDNKARKTYNEVVRDTNDIQAQLQELQEEQKSNE
ncbi:hypothetical protein [Williamwhitmania taraxaci]|uniref:Uncharacterized protein n=1 Tax=Williamwhitmania taraxaci TaxID=1640674 RepID=A0A1G6MD69_9BACT|nr:hypothetical protein [Williamwhitmania taraxaci]SDC53522.1 hypothetical protein SAMN05216323_103546 [Williamwhitmania taraxaci]